MEKEELNIAWDYFGVGFVFILGFLLPLKGISLDQIENIKPALDILHNTASNSTFKTPDLNPLLVIISFVSGLGWLVTLYKALKSDNMSLNFSFFIFGLTVGVFIFLLIP
jgi:hypothetical protein